MNICHPRRKAHACIFMMRREGDGPSRSSACARPASGMSGSTRGGPKCAAPTGFLSASAFGSLGGDRGHRRRTARLSLCRSKNPCTTNEKNSLSDDRDSLSELANVLCFFQQAVALTSSTKVFRSSELLGYNKTSR